MKFLTPASTRIGEQAAGGGGVVLDNSPAGSATDSGTTIFAAKWMIDVDLAACEQVRDQNLVAEIADHQLGLRRNRGPPAGREIVEHDHVLAGVESVHRTIWEPI